MKDCLIAAQYPVPGAGLDLIRLLIDQECTTLVSLNPLSKVQSVNGNLTYNILFSFICKYKQSISCKDFLRFFFMQTVFLIALNINVLQSKEWVPSAAETLSLHKYKVQAGKNVRLSENVCRLTVKMQQESVISIFRLK